MTAPTQTKLKCVQWNARSLKLSKLVEFKVFLQEEDPHIVFISETFWTPNLCYSFPKYTVFRSDRVTKRNGGVALLVKSYLNPARSRRKDINHLEIVGATIAIPGIGPIDAISVYCPKGDATVADLEVLPSRDMGKHNLVMPYELGTRVNPRSGEKTTIDLMLTSHGLKMDAELKTGCSMDSDHLSVIATLNNMITVPGDPLQRWSYSSGRWTEWNTIVKNALVKENFRNASSADEANQILTEAIIAASKHCFSLKHRGANQNRSKPWWNKDCKDACSKTRRLEREWRKHPADLQRRIEYKKSMAVKRRLILKGKREAWEQ